ncbi:hypothetical protein HanXRQr2_Chr14g0659331 [Helianthus annuus]|uniref:Uncharacterized protein n=1 Tax=Helianthus annuus TaxID=4232 RepID=A0A9K3EC55_HELAN|nr:hypothetical protein HanXRQr2_Chr14g0659331 [Helianthus annuus]KAJ0470119.1 hypothetical protein HanIR_Chr14g0715331 [Helianthus annuus]
MESSSSSAAEWMLMNNVINLKASEVVSNNSIQSWVSNHIHADLCLIISMDLLFADLIQWVRTNQEGFINSFSYNWVKIALPLIILHGRLALIRGIFYNFTYLAIDAKFRGIFLQPLFCLMWVTSKTQIALIQGIFL